MTDKSNSILVVLEGEYQTDEAQEIINAIKMIKGVLSAEANIVSSQDYIAEKRVRREYLRKVLSVLK